MGTSVLSFLDVVENGGELYISGHDLRQSLEVAIAAKYSALWGNVPLDLPSPTAHSRSTPGAYRWLPAAIIPGVRRLTQSARRRAFPSVFLGQRHLVGSF